MSTYYHFNEKAYTDFADMVNAYFKANNYYPIKFYKSDVFNFCFNYYYK